MSAIWGHVESVVNQPKSPPSLILNMRTPLGTRRTECIVVDMPAKQPAVMAASPISYGLRVVVEPFEYSRLQKFKLGVWSYLWGVNVPSTFLAVHRARPPRRTNRPTQPPVKEGLYIQTAMDPEYWLSPTILVSGHSCRY